MSSIDPNFDIQKPQSYQDLARFSGLNETDTKTHLQSVKKWALSVATAATPGQSSVRVAKNHIEKCANEKLAEIQKGNPSDNVVDQIEFGKNALDKLRILKQNLRIHNEVITQYNQRFIFKEGVAACKTHDSLLTQIEELEKKIQADLERHCTHYSESIINRLIDQILTGMVIDRTFAQQHYDNIIKQFDIIPIKNRGEALHRLHAVLNKAYIVSLSEKLDANFRKVMPRTVKTLFKKVGLERYFEEFTARKLAGVLSKQIAQFGLGDDIGTLTLPECIEVVHFKFLTFANGLLKESRLSDQYIQGCIDLLHNLHKISLEASAKWKAVASALTNEEIAERIQDYYAKVYKDAPPPNPSTMEQLVEYVRAELAHYPLYRNLDKIIERTSIKDLTDPIFIDRLKTDCMDEEKIKLDCIEVINGACSKFSPNRNAWLERNKSNYDFTFDQSESGSDYVLEDGCCWAISFEWLKRLTQLGSAPVGSYKEFMPPPKPIKVSDNLDIKPSLKRFTEEIEATMNESRITPHMRRMQAQGALERRLANKFQDVVAERLGLHSQILFYKLNTKVENFLTEWMDQLELNAHLGNVLKPLNNVVMFGGKGNGAHAMILQIDPERNLYRFGDPNEGMLTFPTREIFIREMSEYMHIYYDDFHTFYVTAYPKKE